MRLGTRVALHGRAFLGLSSLQKAGMLLTKHVRIATLIGAITLTGPTALNGQAQPAPPTVTLGGVVYAQYLYQLSDTANHVNSFDVTRAYLNVNGRFSDGLATRVTGDVYRNADGSAAYRLKYAYAAYTPNAGPLTFKLGLIHTAWLDWEEALWDYRMQGSMPLERNGGYISSADFGAGVDGRWAGERVDLQLAVVNGENYNRPEGDRRKDLQGRVSVRLANSDDGGRVGGLRLTAYGQLGKPTTGGTRNRFLGMLSYKSSQVTLAGQAAIMRDAVGTLAPPSVRGRLFAAYGVYRIPGSRAAILARVDVVDPNTDVTDNGFTRVIAGASYQLTPNLRLLADLDHLIYQETLTPATYATRSSGLMQVQFTF